MPCHTIDLTAITLLEFVVVRTMTDSLTHAAQTSAAAIELTALLYVWQLDQEIAAFDPSATDAATITLLRNYRNNREACVGLLSKIGAYDDRHIGVLLEAASHLYKGEEDGPETSIRIHDRLTRPFDLAPHETFADEFHRHAPEPDFGKHRSRLLTESEGSALSRYTASATKVPNTLQ